MQCAFHIITMKIAIPLFEKRISPYFDYAPALLIVHIENGGVVNRQEYALTGYDLWKRIQCIKNSDVCLLICGGITNYAHTQIESAGIKIIPWVSGEADDALAQFMKGRLEAGTMLCKGRRRRWCFCAGHHKRKA